MNYLHGVDHIADLDGQLRGRRLGLITNPTGVTSGLVPTIEALRERYELVRLYAPEHGVRGALQAGAKVTNGVDPLSGLPVVSLFGEHEADFAPFEGVDCVLFDIQDIGARFYTYLYTLSDAMKLCARAKVPLIVLDRYNPLGLSRAEGTLLREEFSSGVGRYELPARHAMTIGEFGRYVNAEKQIGCELQVLPCLGLSRRMDVRQVRVPWVMPSPNIPTWESALVYIGTCLFEGTNLSEGRGTTRPFELIGAPWLRADEVTARMNRLELPGARFRTACFTPTFSKHAGQLCAAVQVHVLDPDAFEPFRCGLTLLQTIRETHDELELLPFIDLLAGTDRLRAPDFEPERFLAEEAERIRRFEERIAPYRLYQ